MRMRPLLLTSVAAIVLVGSASLSADRVRLRSGKVVDGAFMSADVKVVRLLLDNGTVSEFVLGDVASIETSPRKAPAAAAATPDPAKKPPPVTIPSGTTLNVRLTQGIDVDAAQAGKTFKALLDDPVMLKGQVVL